MGVGLIDLWMPILLGSVLAWISSALIHMLLKYHNSDYRKLANEDEVAASIRHGSPQTGLHSIPHCKDMSELAEPAMQAKFVDGPVAFVTIFPNGLPRMGKLVGQQVVYFLIGCALIAWCATLALAPGANYMDVFSFVAPVAFLAFGWAVVPFAIWFGHPWSMTAKYLLDALIYALVVAGSFAWLWPRAG